MTECFGSHHLLPTNPWRRDSSIPQAAVPLLVDGAAIWVHFYALTQDTCPEKYFWIFFFRIFIIFRAFLMQESQSINMNSGWIKGFFVTTLSQFRGGLHDIFCYGLCHRESPDSQLRCPSTSTCCRNFTWTACNSSQQHRRPLLCQGTPAPPGAAGHVTAGYLRAPGTLSFSVR